MITKTLSTLILASTLLVSNAVMAKESIKTCQEKMKTIVDISRCLDGVKAHKERELQTWVNNQTFILENLAMNTGRRTALDLFKRSQKNFINYRENSCRWQYVAVVPDPSAATVFKKCFITLTKYRIDELANLNK